MKRWLCLVLGFSFLTIYAQSLTYKVLQDRCQSVNPKYMFSLMFGQNFKYQELTLDGNKYNNKDNISTLLKGTDLTKGSPIGGRFGFLLTDPALYSEGGHKRGMSTLFEMGYRPWTKWYTKVTLGIQLYKR